MGYIQSLFLICPSQIYACTPMLYTTAIMKPFSQQSESTFCILCVYFFLRFNQWVGSWTCANTPAPSSHNLSNECNACELSIPQFMSNWLIINRHYLQLRYSFYPLYNHHPAPPPDCYWSELQPIRDCDINTNIRVTDMSLEKGKRENIEDWLDIGRCSMYYIWDALSCKTGTNTLHKHTVHPTLKLVTRCVDRHILNSGIWNDPGWHMTGVPNR